MDEFTEKPVLDSYHANFDPELYVEDENPKRGILHDSLALSPLPSRGKDWVTIAFSCVIPGKADFKGQIMAYLWTSGTQVPKNCNYDLGFKPVGEKTLLEMSLAHLQAEKSWNKKSPVNRTSESNTFKLSDKKRYSSGDF